MPADAEKSIAKGRLRGLVLPAAVSIAGAAAGVLLSKRPAKLRQVVPSVPDVDLGDLAGELRTKVESMRGTSRSEGGDRRDSDEESRLPSPSELQSRRRERERRRTARRQRTNA
jgi:hypothetical protein